MADPDSGGGAAGRRCAWADGGSALMAAYHDTEWGRPHHDDRYLFELLLLEGAQAGLSWSTVLNKRENYRAALDGFDVRAVAGYGPSKLAELMADPGIVRNRLKVRSTAANARAFLAVGEEFGSFDAYLWGWVGGRPVVNRPAPGEPPTASSSLSDRISKDLKKRGFTFVGTTIVYAYLQAVGVVDDHETTCPAKPGR
ncbi:DNA-3-methyladenine glycosylase I [Allonocardiopsis opalescens]|uniref:DNA-3-methyladenine glycosylase I n=1 Tax=Allonocardiopsis opalescens TaxID=1144618 RepID=A0A2T0Q5C5_9ACTN|nr:DNA-3-methyladenine glycosylase I [Allonocardiopsis opalescens]PRX98970.1 DNA-3-methyladenine glycosylase I [Allonocardiopsis opalescens]